MRDQRQKLEKESTIQLISRIVELSDRQALNVLLETRRLFHLKENPCLLLPEFLMILHDRMAPPEECYAEDCRLADCIYDLTLAKYSNLPDIPKTKQRNGSKAKKWKGVDCRYYYRSFIQEIEKATQDGEIRTPLEEEIRAGHLLQKSVFRSYYFSRKECSRRTPFALRYTWKVGDKQISLWYPSYMTAKEFKSWLKENTKKIDLASLDARREIQNLIERKLRRGYEFSFDEYGTNHIPSASDPSSAFDVKEGHMFIRNLSEAVAKEKSEKIADLRPAIRELGKETVKELVLQIFSGLNLGNYQLAQMAEQYGISKAALSRFAGSKWFEKAGDYAQIRAGDKVDANDKVDIPDLWKNTAQVLAADPIFMDTVASVGFSGNLEWILSRIQEKGRRKRWMKAIDYTSFR